MMAMKSVPISAFCIIPFCAARAPLCPGFGTSQTCAVSPLVRRLHVGSQSCSFSQVNPRVLWCENCVSGPGRVPPHTSQPRVGLRSMPSPCPVPCLSNFFLFSSSARERPALFLAMEQVERHSIAIHVCMATVQGPRPGPFFEECSGSLVFVSSCPGFYFFVVRE